MKYASQKKGKTPVIETGFYDVNDDELSPSTLIGKKCKVITSIKITDIYIGVKPIIQLKVNDVNVKEIIPEEQHKIRLIPKS